MQELPIPRKAQSKIISFYRRNKRMPSYSEVATLVGYQSKNAAFKLVQKMIKHGLIEKDASGKIIPGRLFGRLRLLGTVEAGFPSPAEEELVDIMSLDDYLIRNHDASFILKVSGDSMKDAGILPGDMVIVERGQNPKDGDIVIAEVDQEWTMKYFRKRKGKVFLQPANKKHETITPQNELNIAAIVKAVIRKY